MRYEIGQVLFCGDDSDESVEAAKKYVAHNGLYYPDVKITRRTDNYGTYVCAVACLPIGENNK